MKNNLTILILILSANFVFGQNLTELDNKFGINKFKLESDFNNYKSNLKLFYESDDKIKMYDYEGEDIKDLFGVEINDISLGFYKDKLYSIFLSFKHVNEIDETTLKNKLNSLFGNAESFDITKSKRKLSWDFRWTTKKTELSYYKYSPESNINPNYLYVRMTSAELRVQIDKDNF